MMKFKLILIVFILSISLVNAQQEIKGNYRIHLNSGGESKNSKVPIVLEEESEAEEAIFSYDEKNIIKVSKRYQIIDNNFSFHTIDSDFNFESIIVDLEQKENKLILKTHGETLSSFKKYNTGVNRRLYIDISEGVKISKTSWKASAITIPIKAYLTSQSDSMANFTNNIEADFNIAVTYGKSWEQYLFKQGKEPKLTNTQNLFVFTGINKLELNKKNTDGKNDGDNILSFSTGVGYQYGYGKLGLSFLLGVDIPVSSMRKNWVFKHQPWLGVGVGYSIFK